MGLAGSKTPKSVVVLGASGSVGKATLRALAKQKQATTSIVAGMRDPTKLTAEDLCGAKAVAASMGSANLATALKSEAADVAVIITPGSEDRAELAIASAKSCKEAGVKRIVVVSVTTAGATDTIFGKQFTEAESSIRKLGVPVTFLRLPIFLDNHMGFIASIKGDGKIYCPCDPTKLYSSIAVTDIGTALATLALAPKSFVGKSINIVTKPYTYELVTTTIGKAIGKHLEYVQVPYDAAKAAFLGMGWPEWQTDGLMELFHMIDDGKYDRTATDGTNFKRITGRDPMSLEEWTEANKGAFM